MVTGQQDNPVRRFIARIGAPQVLMLKCTDIFLQLLCTGCIVMSWLFPAWRHPGSELHRGLGGVVLLSIGIHLIASKQIWMNPFRKLYYKLIIVLLGLWIMSPIIFLILYVTGSSIPFQAIVLFTLLMVPAYTLISSAELITLIRTLK